ncbi:MAG: HypC/HybG/HupF family hydrogenase formation chaperone [Arcobacteraceae bacterium]|nr:HypC/HybG/HupF family hydrogenase formation chaperone [Arcobacteraceae bacterium]
MCLSIPSKVTKIDKNTNIATVNTMGINRDASLDLMEEGIVNIGDYVLLHVGFIINKIDEEDALLSLETFKNILEQMDEDELKQTIKDSDNCQNE